MKTLLFVVPSLLLASATLASQPSAELRQVTRALINSPDIMAKLKQNGSFGLSDIQITEPTHGINKYVLIFSRECNCVPSTATVNITEDMTPTYADGSPKYESSITIKKGP
jgi:hypothetical protein